MPGNWNSGRRPQPTKLRILRGNPSKTKINPHEPEPPTVDESFDIPPAELDGDVLAIAEWKRVAPILRVCGLVSQAERPAIIALCQQWSRYLDAQAKVRSLGMVVQDRNREPMTNPYLDVADKALSHCHRLWSEMGLTPSGRARVSRLPTGRVPPVTPASKWGSLI